MLYRVHRPHNLNGSYGTLLGYINLCQGHINIHHIHENLLKAKIIPEHWFTPEEIQSSGAGSHIYGVNAYAVLRRPPYSRTHLFYLYPVESQEDKQVFNPWNAASYVSPGTITSGTITFTTTFNNYIATSAATFNPMIIQPQAYTTAQQTPRAQEPQNQLEPEERFIDAFDAANEY